MRSCCEYLIVMFHTQVFHNGAAVAPHLVDYRYGILLGLLQRRQDNATILIQTGETGLDPAFLGASDRMAGYEAGKHVPEFSACRGDDRTLGAANIGDDGVFANATRKLGEYRLHCSERHCHHNNVGVPDCSCNRGFVTVEYTEFDTFFEIVAITSLSDYVTNVTRLVQGQRHRTAEDTDSYKTKPNEDES